MQNSNNTGKLFGALLLGAAIGGALGILFAPDKGSETRKRISSKGNDLTDAMKEKVDELLEEFKNEAETVKNNVTQYAENGLAAIDKFKVN